MGKSLSYHFYSIFWAAQLVSTLLILQLHLLYTLEIPYSSGS